SFSSASFCTSSEIRLLTIDSKTENKSKTSRSSSSRSDRSEDAIKRCSFRLRKRSSRSSESAGTERELLIPPERLILTPLGPEDGRSGQERQFALHSDFRLVLDFIDSRKR